MDDIYLLMMTSLNAVFVVSFNVVELHNAFLTYVMESLLPAKLIQAICVK